MTILVSYWGPQHLHRREQDFNASLSVVAMTIYSCN